MENSVSGSNSKPTYMNTEPAGMERS